ncbi:MAG: hypothetical protein ABFD54_13930 [Armatimonadota bacterium]|nr:hypothetical protein [bacterium]
MKLDILLVVCVIAVSLSVSTPVYARGGVYIDDLVLKNGGTVIFSESFDSDDLSGWYSSNDASISTDHSCSTSNSLYENWHGGSPATISTNISISNPALLELSFNVFLPDTLEQWNNGGGAHVTALYIILHSNTTNKDYTSGLWLYPYDTSYRMYLNGKYSGPSCASGNWQNVLVRLDPSNVNCISRRATMLLNNNVLLFEGYSATDFPTIDTLTVFSNFGDAQPIPEPSCITTLIAGLVTFGTALRRRDHRI